MRRRSPHTRALRTIAACAIAGAVVVLVAQAAPARTAATYTVSIASPSPQSEGNSGSSSLVFTVSISPRVNDPSPVTVDYATSNGSATAGEDYSATSGSLTVTQDAPADISVEVLGDTTVEPDEAFSVDLSGASGATVADGSATGTIVNDDVAPPPPPPPSVGPDLALVMTTDTSTVTVGGTARFSIGVKNNGAGPATGVLVNDTLPASLQLTSISASQGSCSGSSCSIGSIAQGATASVERHRASDGRREGGQHSIRVAEPPRSRAGERDGVGDRGRRLERTASASSASADTAASDTDRGERRAVER